MAVQEIEGQGFDRSVLEPAVLTDAEAELDCYLFLLKLLFIPQLQDLVDAPAHRTGRFGRRGTHRLDGVQQDMLQLCAC